MLGAKGKCINLKINILIYLNCIKVPIPSFSYWLDLCGSELWIDHWKPSKRVSKCIFLSFFLFFEGAKAMCPSIGSHDMVHIRSESCSLEREEETLYLRWKCRVILHLVRTQLLHCCSGLHNPPGMWDHPTP